MSRLLWLVDSKSKQHNCGQLAEDCLDLKGIRRKLDRALIIIGWSVAADIEFGSSADEVSRPAFRSDTERNNSEENGCWEGWTR